jgi:signal peptidase II
MTSARSPAPPRAPRHDDRPTGAGLRGLRLTLAVAAVCFAFDRATKWGVVEVLDLRSRGIVPVAPPWIHLMMAWNTGANFGLGAGLGKMFWIALALAISAGLLIWSLRLGDMRQRLCVGLLVGGALGNALDRWIYGAVADFLNVTCCGLRNPYAFNPADIFIFAGAIGLVLFAPSPEPQDRAKPPRR